MNHTTAHELAESVFDKAGKYLDGSEFRPCAVIVSFLSEDFIDLCFSRFRAVLPTVSRYGNNLAGFAPSAEEADRIVKVFSEVVADYNHELLKEPFDANWLEDYIGYSSLGIENIYCDDELTCPDEFTSYFLNCERQAMASRAKEEQEEIAESESVSYDRERLVSDFTEFFIDNGVGYDDEGQLRTLFSSMADCIQSEIASKDSSSVLDLMSQADIYVEPILRKQGFIHRPNTAFREEVLRTREILTDNVRDTRKRIPCSALQGLISSTLPQLSIRGLDEALGRELDDTDLEDLQLQAGFSGIDLSFVGDDCDPSFSVNESLSVPNLHYQIRSRRGSFEKVLARCFADYYWAVLEMKNNDAFCAELIRIAGNLEAEPFHGDLLAVADKTANSL